MGLYSYSLSVRYREQQKTMPLGVVQEKLMDHPSFPLAQVNVEGRVGGNKPWPLFL